MIGLVRGEVVVRRPDHVVVIAGGVGYRLAVSAETLRHVPAAGSPTTLHSHLIVRDDALALFGFATEEERDLFLLLLGVQAVPGIGKRTAERIIVELREKVGPEAEPAITVTRGDSPRHLARDGLVELGYTPVEAEELLRDVDGETAEELLAGALRAARTGRRTVG